MAVVKREPLLADLLAVPSRETFLPQIDAANRANLLLAKRFVMDDTATKYVGEMIRDIPRIIADAQDFAIPPFERMWIEFPFDVLWHTVNPNPPPDQILGPTDKKIGFLIVGNHVRIGVNSGGDDPAAWCPYEYVLNYPMSIEAQVNFVQKYGLSRIGLDHLYWGSSFFKWMGHVKAQSPDEVVSHLMMMKDKNMTTDEMVNEIVNKMEVGRGELSIFSPGEAKEHLGELQKRGITTNEMIDTVIEEVKHRTSDSEEREARRQSLCALRESHSINIFDPPGIDPKDFFHMTVAQSAGYLRNIISILLFLNRTSDLQTQKDVPHGKGFINRQPKPFLKHTVITIKLDPKPRFQKMVAGHGQWRRLHDVRGHFCHNERARTAPCMHAEWEEIRPLYWVCPQCKGAKWWRHEHSRGHEEKGIVTSEYRVKK